MSKDSKPGADAQDTKAIADEKPAPPPVVQAAAAPKAETKTPAEWASQLGHTRKRDPRLPQSLDHVDPAFAVANLLYGWSDRAYNFQAPEDAFRIPEATYREALKSAPQFPAIELTQDALTPERAEALKNHKPAKNLKVERAEQAAAEAAAEAAEAKKKGNG